MEMFGNYKEDEDSNPLPKAVKLILEKRKMKKVKNDTWDYYLPSGYTYCEANALKFENEDSGRRMFTIDGCDWLASKVSLWELIKKEFGDRANELMPETFILSNKEDMDRFKKFYQKKKEENKNYKFISKNFKQRQEGLKMFNNIDEIINSSSKFKIVQDYLENPYLIAKRKINLRYYLLITCYKGEVEGWIYNDGFVYYTPKPFVKYSMNEYENITTCYIDRKIYEENPLTLKDFRKHLGPYISNQWDEEINKKFSMLMKAISNEICSNQKLSKHLRFQIFGADIAPDENLNATIIELNKGPDISFKDERDGNVKKKLIEDMFEIIEPSGENIITGFKRIF